jgi:hypothetical protein
VKYRQRVIGFETKRDVMVVPKRDWQVDHRNRYTGTLHYMWYYVDDLVGNCMDSDQVDRRFSQVKRVD